MTSIIPHIFVVDDEEINRDIITEYFEDMSEKYQLETAVDGEDAWEKLQQDPEKFDVILLDRMMPGMSGMDVLAKIKEHPILTHLPVIFQSALSSNEDISEGIKAGAHYYLTKPFEFELLYSVIKTAVHERLEFRRMTMELTEQYSTMNCLTYATFRFQTVDEARKLAVLLANACDNIEKTVMGLTELFINAVEHGNLAITYDEKSEFNTNDTLTQEIENRLVLDEYKFKFVEVTFSHSEDMIEITITDQGNGFEWEQYLTIAPERVLDNHGRGIAMASMISFDKLEYMGCGNSVKATINTQ